jgi:hypothetical protein
VAVRRGEETAQPPPRFPQTADAYQAFDNRPLAPERSSLKKTEKKAAASAKLKATQFEGDYEPERFAARPQQPAPLAAVAVLSGEGERFPGPVERVYAAEPPKQKKVAERNAQVNNDDILSLLYCNLNI